MEDAAARLSNPQITTRLHETERAEFRTYARSFGLDPASLLVLLLARERRVGRLASLLASDPPWSGARKSTVTIHKKDPELHARVDALAEEHGASVSNVCAALIVAELGERWLDRVLPTRFESH